MSRKYPRLDESSMQQLESRIPELAARAGLAAHRRALQSFGRVVTVQDDKLVELKSDGSFTIVKALPPALKVRPGLVLKRRPKRTRP